MSAGQWWRPGSTQPSSTNDAISGTSRARPLRVAKLRDYLSYPKLGFPLCSQQCGLLVVAMERVASWLARWERKTLPALFVQDMLILATRGVRLLEDLKHLNASTWLVMAAFKMESREDFLALFQGFLQNVMGYVEVLQEPPFSRCSMFGSVPLPPSSLWSAASASDHEACICEAKSLSMSLKEDLHFLTLKAAEDRRALAHSLEQGSFAEGEESRIALLLRERLEDKGKQNNPFQLDSPDIMHGKLELLGEGSFGGVYKAEWMGVMVAVKQFNVPGTLNAELKALLKTRHVNVMRAIAYCSKEGHRNSWLLMERMEGDLGKFVNKLEAAKADLPISVSIDILLQIACGMAHLHEKNVMHRDLNPNNILFNRWPPMSAQQLQEGPADFTAKITDFGGARTQTYHTTQATAKLGTLCYRAPEVLREVEDGKARYSNKADVFSFGMVCYKLLTKSDPYLSGEKAMNGDYTGLKFPLDLPQAFIYLVRRCWARAHQKRPSFAQICDFLALFKSIVLNTSSSGKPPLYYGIREDVLTKLEGFLGKDWLMEEAILLGVGLDEFDEASIRLRVRNKLAGSPEADYFRWLRCCLGELS